MKEWIYKWFSSRTITAQAIIATLGVVEIKLHLMQDMLGEWFGLSFMIIAALGTYLRAVTTKPLGK